PRHRASGLEDWILNATGRRPCSVGPWNRSRNVSRRIPGDRQDHVSPRVVLNEVPDSVALAEVRLERASPAMGSRKLVIDDRSRSVGGLPARQTSSPSEIDILGVGDELFAEPSNLVARVATLQVRAL